MNFTHFQVGNAKWYYSLICFPSPQLGKDLFSATPLICISAQTLEHLFVKWKTERWFMAFCRVSREVTSFFRTGHVSLRRLRYSHSPLPYRIHLTQPTKINRSAGCKPKAFPLTMPLFFWFMSPSQFKFLFLILCWLMTGLIMLSVPTQLSTINFVNFFELRQKGSVWR